MHTTVSAFNISLIETGKEKQSMNWDDLRYFLALSRKNSFVAASTDLQVTHTTVARRISALEKSLQTMLFHRTEKGCQLTAAGEKLAPYAERLETTIIQLQESLADQNRQLTGSVRIGAPDGIGHGYLVSRLGLLRSMYRGLEIELIAVPMYYSLSKREIDILITVQRPTRGNIIAKRLTRYRLGLFATRHYLDGAPPIVKKKDLEEHVIISYIDDLLFDQDLNFMEEIYPGLTASFRTSTVVAQLNGVASGIGIGVIPFFMANAEPRLEPVLPEHSIERSYWMQVSPESRQLARVRTTMDFLISQFASEKHLFLSPPQLSRDRAIQD